MSTGVSQGGRAGRPLQGAAVAAALGVLALAGSAAAAPWSAPAQRSPVAAEASSPRIAVNANGDAVAVWTRLDGDQRQVEAALRPAGAPDWGPAETVSLIGDGDAYLPAVAIDSAGAAYAVWTRTTRGGLVVQAAVRPAGATVWDPPQNVSATQRQAASASVSVSPDGHAAAAWTGRAGSRMVIQIARRSPGDASWGPASGISRNGQNAVEPAVVVDPAGTAAVVWRRYDSRVYRVQFTLCPLGAGCLAPRSLSQAGRSAVNPRIGVDGAGNVHVLWRRFDGVRYRVQAVARDATGVFTPVATISALASTVPQLAVSANGEAVAAWRTYGRGERIQASARLPATGQWADPTDLSRPGRNVRYTAPRIAVDPTGNTVVLWERPRIGDDRLESAVRAPGAGVFAPAEPVAGGGEIVDPTLALDGTGLARGLFVQTVPGGGRALFSTDRPPG